MSAEVAGDDALRVGIVADTHGFLDPRVAAALADCHRVVHAGDIGGDAILAPLDRRAGAALAVAGNNDTPHHWPAAEQERLSALPGEAWLELPGGALVVTHGHTLPARDRHRRLRRRYPTAAAIVYGHSHRAAVDTAVTPWVLNPGAGGRNRALGGPGCLVLCATGERWAVEEHRFERLARRRSRG